jgi:hypothetical protein
MYLVGGKPPTLGPGAISLSAYRPPGRNSGGGPSVESYILHTGRFGGRPVRIERQVAVVTAGLPASSDPEKVRRQR